MMNIHSGLQPTFLTYRCGGSAGFMEFFSHAPASRLTVSRTWYTEPKASEAKFSLLQGWCQL